MTKIQCNSCLKWKDPEDFNWRYKALGIRHPTCRECQKPLRKNWYEDNKDTHLKNVRDHKERVRQAAREFVWDYLSTHPCISCGETDPVVLEFHHRGGKDKAVSQMVADRLSLDRIKAEIAKCDVLCSNCHRRVIAKNQGWLGNSTCLNLILKYPSMANTLNNRVGSGFKSLFGHSKHPACSSRLFLF